MEEIVEDDDMTPESKEQNKMDFLPSCFFAGFNGPTDPGFAHISQTNSSDPLTLLQATKRPDWHKWEAAIQDELKSLEAFSTFEIVTLPPGNMSLKSSTNQMAQLKSIKSDWSLRASFNKKVSIIMKFLQQL